MGEASTTRAPRPTLVWHVLTLCWLGPALLMTARVFPGLGLLGAVVFSGVLLGALWLVSFARVLLPDEARPRLDGRAVAGWMSFPAMVALVALLLLTRWPLVARVRLSEGPLLELVRGARAEPARGARAVRAGLMSVDDVYAGEDCVFLRTNSGLGFREYGLAYAPGGAKPTRGYRSGPTTFRHLTGGWWTFEASD